MTRLVLALLALCMLAAGATSASAKRVALIVGNSAYKSVSQLPNPVSDARAMADTLTRLGFENVHLKLDQDFSTFRRSLRQFSRDAAGAELALVFYAGHGIEVGGRNYLIPIDAELGDASDVDFEAIPLSMVMGALDRVKKLKMVVLDACRDNPFSARMKKPGATRSIGRGLARVTPQGQNSLVAYAAREGTVARDGDGRHSPYVTALLSHLETPGLEIGFLFRKVRDTVVESTGGQQEPFVYGSLSGDAIYLKAPGARPAPPPPAKPAPTTQVPASGAAQAWEHVKNSTDVVMLKAFITQYGSSNVFYAQLAKSRIKTLEDKQAALSPDVTETPAPVAPAPDRDYPIKGNCKADLATWRKKASIGAFAVERGGGCGWSYGFNTLEEARKRAIAECNKQGPDCKVVKVHQDKTGDWSLSQNCKRDLKTWRTKTSIGAFAVERRGGCGWSWGYKNVAEAREAATKSCKKQGPECRVIDLHTDKRGDWSLSEACKKSLAEWREKSKKGAFAVERGGGCGWSFGFKTVQPARSRAIVECRKQGPDCRVHEVR